MSFCPIAKLWQFFLGVLQKMRGGAVGLKRGIVFVLLVDEKSAGFGLVPVNHVHQAAGLLTGLFRQLGKDSSQFSFTANFPAAAPTAAANQRTFLDMYISPFTGPVAALVVRPAAADRLETMKGRQADSGQPVSATAPAQGEAISPMPCCRPVAGSRSTALGQANCTG